MDPVQKTSYYLYMLTSLKAKWHYTGHAEDVEKRVQAPNSRKVQSTRPWRPLKIFYTEEYATKSEGNLVGRGDMHGISSSQAKNR